SRTLVAVDVGENLGPADANGRVAIAPGDEVDSLEVMRATVQGRAVGEDARFRPAVELARRMTGVRYVVIVADGEPGVTPVDPARASAATFQPAVTIDTELAGVHEGGRTFRMDDVPLPLRPALEAPHGALVTVRALRERLRT